MGTEFQLDFLIKVSISILLGGIVGVEREFAKKSAGIRTHMLICGVSTLLVGIGYAFAFSYESISLNDFFQADPYRIISAIITGIGFIGAGTIIQRESKERIDGLTTAASLLFVAAIGMAVGLNQYYLAIGSTIILLLVNYLIRILQFWIMKKINYKVHD